MTLPPVPIPESTEAVAKKVVDSAFSVHKNLGPGLLENIYQVCLCHELSGFRLGLLVNFNVPLIKGIIKRIAL
jgi:hypothetical protein